jgi:4-amino-4-deoxy-L-arabinose transferase-like glycosyltransferase
VVLALAAPLLGWLVAHTDIFFADGLRYIAQARAIASGTFAQSITTAVDHPAYPVAVAAVHRLVGGDGPEGWQRAAQLASIVSALLLVVPLYLIARHVFGDRAALPGCLLFYMVPVTGHVFADTLSESTFLLFWAWGLWGALRFFKNGGLGWLALGVAGSGLAYLSRPEGLLLPAAVVATFVLCPRWVVGSLRGRRVVLGMAVLVAGSAALVGPYVAIRGGLATKPSIARLLGTAPRSHAFAVERQRPLDPRQGAAKTYAVAAKAVIKAVTDALTWPLVPLALIGLIGLRPRGPEARQWTLLAVIGGASMVALVRLHATGGYCSPRHALIPILILIPAAGAGLVGLIDRITGAASRRVWHASGPALVRLRAGALAAVLAGLAGVLAPEILAPVNEGLQGYKEAGRWLAARAGDDHREAPIVDVTGWSQFYGGRTGGYTFENLAAASADPVARWVVVRESHLIGPWFYCKQLDTLVAGRAPVQVFVGATRHRPTRVFVFDRQAPLASRPHRPSSPVLR